MKQIATKGIVTHGVLSTNYQLVGPELTDDVPPVALIHGLGANMAFWYLGAVRHLGRDRTLLLYDLRGHGASSMPEGGYSLEQLADDFRQLLDDLGVARAHVVGHSHGARVAIAFSQSFPERVESLVIADTQIRELQAPMKLCDWPYWSEWKADLMRRGVTTFPPDDSIIDFQLLSTLGPRATGGPLNAQRPGRRQGRSAGRAGGGRRIDLRSRQMGPRGAEQWQSLLASTSAMEELGDESAINLEALAKFDRPVLLMYGRHSHCLPTSEALERLFPDVRRVLIPGAGHFFPIVKPRFFARALRMFLARVDRREGRPVPGNAPRSEGARPAERRRIRGLLRRQG